MKLQKRLLYFFTFFSFSGNELFYWWYNFLSWVCTSETSCDSDIYLLPYDTLDIWFLGFKASGNLMFKMLKYLKEMIENDSVGKISIMIPRTDTMAKLEKQIVTGLQRNELVLMKFITC